MFAAKDCAETEEWLIKVKTIITYKIANVLHPSLAFRLAFREVETNYNREDDGVGTHHFLR